MLSSKAFAVIFVLIANNISALATHSSSFYSVSSIVLLCVR